MSAGRVTRSVRNQRPSNAGEEHRADEAGEEALGDLNHAAALSARIVLGSMSRSQFSQWRSMISAIDSARPHSGQPVKCSRIAAR